MVAILYIFFYYVIYYTKQLAQTNIRVLMLTTDLVDRNNCFMFLLCSNIN